MKSSCFQLFITCGRKLEHTLTRKLQLIYFQIILKYTYKESHVIEKKMQYFQLEKQVLIFMDCFFPKKKKKKKPQDGKREK